MLRRFSQGSVRWQIVTLAVLPIFFVGVLGILTEPTNPEDTELTRAEVSAAQIALVAQLIDGAASSEQIEAVLAATHNSGLQANWLPAKTAAGPAVVGSDFQNRLYFALTNIHGRRAHLAVGPDNESIVMVEVRNGMLAFAPVAGPVPGLNDDVTNILMSVLLIVLPAALLSTYAARLVTKPLTRIAAAAQASGTGNRSGDVFDESGPLEIRQLARKLNEMRAQISDMLRERTAMLRAVSHDLRTPLTRLKLRVERSVPAETAGVLMRDIAAINDMIDETLNYLRTDTESEARRKTDLPSLLSTICSDYSDIGYSVTYTGPDRLTFRCRPRALARAVSNLVDNGTKYGKKVEVRLTPLAGGAIRIEVLDDGPGIPVQLRTRALEPFVKGDPSRNPSSRSGFGLGLSIASELIRRQGGTMELAAGSPKGLVVSLTLPAFT